MRYYLVGRDPEACHIALDDPSQTVSRLHAEITITRDGRYYFADRGSTNGSFRQQGSGWARLDRDYVAIGEPLKLGDFRTTVEALLRLAGASVGGVQPSADPHRLGGEVIWDDDQGRYVPVPKGAGS